MHESKTTDEMRNGLNQCDDLEMFLIQNSDNFRTVSIETYLKEYLEVHHLKKSEVIRKSGLNQVYAYQIFSGVRRAERDKLLCIALAAGMSVLEADRLLAAGGKQPIYPRVMRDAVIEYALTHHFTVEETDDLLYDHDCRTLMDD